MTKNALSWVEARDVSLRAAGNSIVGHAAVYNSLSEDLGGFVEVIRPGAFKGVFNSDVRALINHDPNLLLGRTRSGTLKLRDDLVGLAMEIRLSEATYAQDLRIAMSRGDITQCSFSFNVGVDRWTPQGKTMLREILVISALFDVSVVTYPAYLAADAGLRQTNFAGGRKFSTDLARKKLDLLLITQGEKP